MYNCKTVSSLKSLLVLFTLTVGYPTVQAAPVAALTTFSAGTPAKAAEVNANFNAVKTAADANDARIAALEAQAATQLGYALISGYAPTVLTYGGTGTTSVTVVKNATGYYTMIFHGNYPATITANNVVILTTTAANGDYVSNARVDTASPTTITASVYVFSSNTGTLVDNWVNMLLLLGK